MTGTATRYLHLVRHGEALPDESGLTENGRRQAVLRGERLRDVPVSAVHHGPLPRAAQTARLIGEQLKDVPLHVSDAAGDYLPDVPERGELPPESSDFLLRFLDRSTAEVAYYLLRRYRPSVRRPVRLPEPFKYVALVVAACLFAFWAYGGISYARIGNTEIYYFLGWATAALYLPLYLYRTRVEDKKYAGEQAPPAPLSEVAQSAN